MNNLLDNLVFYLLVSIVVTGCLALVKTRKSHYTFSLVVIFLGMGVLYYSYFSEKPKLEDYKVEQIQYSECLCDEEQSIVLKTNDYQYVITKNLINRVTTIDEVSLILCNNSEAKVWITELKGARKLVKGLETPNLSVPIAIGIELDDPSNLAFVGWLFLVLGILIFVLTIIYGDLVISYIA